jgi:nucleotide-binding universal stress UspA family protein
MRNIIIAFDGSQYSEGAMAFARKMNYAERITITGLFLPQTIFSNLWSYADSGSGAAFIPLIESDDSAQINENIARFEQECKKYNIRYKVKKEFFDLAIPELQKETRFADLVILGSESFYTQVGREHSNEYLRDALHSSECPVIVVPEVYTYPEINILAYDGSESSVFAIKQFMYLFPEFAEQPTILVSIRVPATDYTKNTDNIHALVSDHFSNLSFMNLNIDAEKYFSTWLSEKKGSILVCGAYSRSLLSQLFHQSFVEDVIIDHKIPVFISHR